MTSYILSIKEDSRRLEFLKHWQTGICFKYGRWEYYQRSSSITRFSDTDERQDIIWGGYPFSTFAIYDNTICIIAFTQRLERGSRLTLKRISITDEDMNFIEDVEHHVDVIGEVKRYVFTPDGIEIYTEDTHPLFIYKYKFYADDLTEGRLIPNPIEHVPINHTSAISYDDQETLAYGDNGVGVAYYGDGIILTIISDGFPIEINNKHNHVLVVTINNSWLKFLD